MEGAGVNSPPPLEVSAGPSIRAERRFGRLFGRAVAALNRRTGRRAGSWAPASLGLASAAPGTARPDHVIGDSSSDEEGSSVLHR